MDAELSQFFVSRWQTYFAHAELPICYYYTDHPRDEDKSETQNVHRCLIGNLSRVRDGFAFVYDVTSPGCAGGKRFSGMTQTLRPRFEYFLSCGIPGEMEGERYKKSPDLVKSYQTEYAPFQAPGTHLVFKRWDKLTQAEQPVAAIFFATPDVLSGLFTLANFDVGHPNGVIAPMGSGCASILQYVYAEANSENPRCVLGMFDVSARPCVPEGTLTFTAPMQRLEQMSRNMDESFLITKSWAAVRSRL